MRMRSLVLLLIAALSNAGCNHTSRTPPAPEPRIEFQSTSETVDCYDFAEAALTLQRPVPGNPFRDVIVSGTFREAHAGDEIPVDGFCDSTDGTVYRIRFMPTRPGFYTYVVTFQEGKWMKSFSGSFQAVDAKRRGLVRVDRDYPWHFIWEGTGEHYFLNGTTAFLLMGWDDDGVVRNCISRLHGLGINRIRVLLDGRANHFWTEPIRPGHGFLANLLPWVARRPDNVVAPGFDYTRFSPVYWQRFEKMLRFARDSDMTISVIFGFADTDVRPAMGSDDERRYFEYAVARLAAFSNLTWDLGDDLDAYRSDAWTHEFGTMLYRMDPYHHLATSHPRKNQHQDRASAWFGMTSLQEWPRPLHEWMLDQRRQQEATGRIIPQVNEEYGYEDHYPDWAPYRSPGASAGANLRAAWEMVMAGGYQTTGETAKRGTGIPPDTGGGWVNGRGDSTMTMLQGYAFMARFFTSLPWWRTNPHDELVSRGYCLAEPGELYVLYLPGGGHVALKAPAGRYEATWFDPRTGAYGSPSVATGPVWTSPTATGADDWVLLLKRAR
jgi:hypothetical protein